jgi:hypothetical protein
LVPPNLSFIPDWRSQSFVDSMSRLPLELAAYLGQYPFKTRQVFGRLK